MKRTSTLCLCLAFLCFFVSPMTHAQSPNGNSGQMGPFGPWSQPINLGPSINTPYSEFHSAISRDELTIFFAADRPGGFGGNDLYVAERDSRDGQTLYFTSDRRPGCRGGNDFYLITRPDLRDR